MYLMQVLLLPLLLPAAQASGDSSKSADLNCSACRAVSRAILTAIETAKSPPKAEDDKAKFARLSDAVERVCRHLPIYGRMQHQEKQDRWGLVTMTRDDGKPVDMEQIDADPGLGNWLRMRCEELLDDREEAVARQAVQRPRQLEAWLCAEVAAVCTAEQLALDFVAPIDPVVASGRQKLDLKFDSVKPEL
ncbi:hypothetical protein BOX15_Mlig000048g9 [Macrostomum lignano]|uniref:Saposin B-type domain-containing protein n=1 Tax=Macrostomum lignano TaxID=282301 RepID=A0A267FVH4_9PLAT|nr:hypothetical protein BOX15_Mlig000048g9 [Macrostomum lignano]